MMIFSGSASKALGSDVARRLGLREGTVESSRFTNGELRVRITEDTINSQAAVVQTLAAPVDSNIIEFTLICDALQREGIKETVAVIPFLGYSKQDKVFRPGEPLSVKVIAKILQVVPIKRLITFDLHNLAILGFFDIPVTNLSATPLFTEYFKKDLSPKAVVVAPDAGAIKASTAFAMDLGIPIVYMDKKRDLTSGKVTVLGISRPVKGTDVIIVDDMIVTGSTLIETAKYLKEEGARSISVAATHHLYVPGAQEALDASEIDNLIVTDTVAPKGRTGKLTVLSVAELIGKELRKLID